LHSFEAYTKFREFRDFHIGQAVGFKRNLAEQVSFRTKERLSKATLYSTLMALRNFFHRLAGRPGYRSRLSYWDTDYFNLSEKETWIAKAHRDQRVPTIAQIEHVIQAMPANSDIERRNRALIAFALGRAPAIVRLPRSSIQAQAH
jgi:integrase/recombinase XerD